MKKESLMNVYYEPHVEIIDVVVEKGFANSPGDGETEGTGEDDWGS